MRQLSRLMSARTMRRTTFAAACALAGGSRVVDPQATASAIFAVKQQVESIGARFLPVAGDVANLEIHEGMLSAVLA